MAWAQQQRNGTYRAMFRDSDGKQRSAGVFTRKKDAETAATRAEGIARLQPKTLATVTVDEFYSRWEPRREVAASTRREDRHRFEARVLPRWGDVALGKLKRADIQDWVGELKGEGLAESTIVKTVHNLSALCKAAVKDDLLAANPCTGVELPKIPQTPDRFLDDDEVVAVRAALDGMNGLIFDVLIGTGLRWGEMAGLHWDHVNFEEKRIEVALSWDRRTRLFKQPKTNQVRYVPITQALTDELTAHLDRDGWGVPPTGVEYASVRPRFGVVIAGPSGLPWAPTNFGHALDAAGMAATVGEGKRARKVGHVRPHDLRHTYASRLVRRGVPIQEVSKLLGHSSLLVTQRYARLGTSQWDAVRAALTD